MMLVMRGWIRDIEVLIRGQRLQFKRYMGYCECSSVCLQIYDGRALFWSVNKPVLCYFEKFLSSKALFEYSFRQIEACRTEICDVLSFLINSMQRNATSGYIDEKGIHPRRSTSRFIQA